MNSDVTILYQGASGGFLLFYYLLLTGRYSTGIRRRDNVEELIQQQFNTQLILDRSRWKDREFWPDNVWSKQNQSGNRLFLICNPFFNPEVHNTNCHVADGTYKILLYTDLKLQARMAWEKQAWWFTTTSRQKYQQCTEREYLKWVLSQGPIDPHVNSIRNVYAPDLEIRLEDFIRNPILPEFASPTSTQIDFVDYWVSLQSPKAQRLLKRVGGP